MGLTKLTVIRWGREIKSMYINTDKVTGSGPRPVIPQPHKWVEPNSKSPNLQHLEEHNSF